jgi:hypothetical protein
MTTSSPRRPAVPSTIHDTFTFEIKLISTAILLVTEVVLCDYFGKVTCLCPPLLAGQEIKKC